MKSYKVAHILVTARHEAEDLLRKLNGGATFEDLARKFSQCSSASAGGDLGEIRMGKADSDFEDAALKLKPGQVSKAPVRSRFGYHIIKRFAD